MFFVDENLAERKKKIFWQVREAKETALLATEIDLDVL